MFQDSTASNADVQADGTEWFVIRSKPRREQIAVESLERRGITAYCPWIAEPVGWANEWATVPLFPGYLFVAIRLEEAFHTVMWTPGVKSFVAFGSVPTPVHRSVVDFLQSESGEDGIIRPISSLKSGQRVRIRRGPFAGLVGIIEKPCHERGRIRVLMDFLRQGTVVEVPIAAVGRP